MRNICVLYARDRTETTSQVWLGLTAGCAVCHDHKYDPSAAEGILLAVRFLQQHHAKGDGRQHQGHAADHRWCHARRSRALGGIARRIKKLPKERIDHRRESAQTDFDDWLTNGPRRKFSRERCRRMNPAFHALLADDKPQTIKVRIEGRNAAKSIWPPMPPGRKASSAAKAFTTSSKTTPDDRGCGGFRKGPGVFLWRVGLS